MISLLSRLFARAKRPQVKTRTKQVRYYRPQLEPLEDRVLPSVSTTLALAVTASNYDNTLLVNYVPGFPDIIYGGIPPQWFVIQIDSEQMTVYTSHDTARIGGQLFQFFGPGVDRAANGTVLAAHPMGATVTLISTHLNSGSPPSPPTPSPLVLTDTLDPTTFRPTFSWTDVDPANPDVRYNLTVTNTISGQSYSKPNLRGTDFTFGFDLAPGAYQAVVNATGGGVSLTSQPDLLETGISAKILQNTLIIFGTPQSDSIYVGQNNGQISIQGATNGHSAGVLMVAILQNGSFENQVSANQISEIDAFAQGGGPDYILLNQGAQPITCKAEIIGNAGNSLNQYTFAAGTRTPGMTKYINCEWIANNWAPNGTPINDVRQGQEGNCSFLAALAEVALRGNIDLQDRIVYLGNDGNPADAFLYQVQLYGRPGFPVYVKVEFTGGIGGNDPQPFATPATGSPPPPGPYQFWTILFARAYKTLTGNNIYRTVALTVLTGGESSYRPIFSSLPASWNNWVFNRMEAVIDDGGYVLTGTPSGIPPDRRLKGYHSYTVLSLRRDRAGNPASVTIRNPWGYIITPGDSATGVITLTWVTFVRNMGDIEFSLFD